MSVSVWVGATVCRCGIILMSFIILSLSCLQYVSADGHAMAAFPVQSPPPPGYSVHPHQHPVTAYPAGTPGSVVGRPPLPPGSVPQQPPPPDKRELMW